MCNRFKMSNCIFEYGLSPNELHIYTVMCSIYSSYYQHNVVVIKQSTLAAKCGIKTPETISRGVGSLIRRGLIKRVDRFLKRNGDPGTYHYVITLPQELGNYFYVPRSIIGKLNSVQMRMYLFICKCLDSKTGECWNSYNDISNALHIKRSSVIATIKELVQMNVIEKIKVMKKDGSASDNHYRLASSVVVLIRNFFKKKDNRLCENLLSLVSVLKLHNNRHRSCLHFYYALKQLHCQAFFIQIFFVRGSPLNNGSFIVPIFIFQREKILRYIYQHSRYR